MNLDPVSCFGWFSLKDSDCCHVHIGYHTDSEGLIYIGLCGFSTHKHKLTSLLEATGRKPSKEVCKNCVDLARHLAKMSGIKELIWTP